MKFTTKLLLLILCLAPGTLLATSNLYSSEVPVADDTTGSRQQGVEGAFRQMLVKVTGSRSVLNQPGSQDMIRRAFDYLQQYRYRIKESGDEATPSQRYLSAQFDKEAVDRSLRTAGLQPWNAARPRMLVWIAEGSQGQRSLINTEQDGEVAAVLDGAAQQRGFPLRKPLFDLQDQSAISAAQIWGMDLEAIRAASERYPQNAVLVGRLRGNGEQNWSADWVLLGKESEFRFKSGPGERDVVLASGVDQAIDQLAQQYAPVDTNAAVETLRLQILGVTGLAEYAHTLDLLKQQDSVLQVSLLQVQSDSLLLDVRVRGDASVLRKALELHGELRQEHESVQVVEGKSLVMAVYRLN